MTRPVEVFKWHRDTDAAYDAPYEKMPDGTGIFHQFGVDGEWSSDGSIIWTTAIVERADGTVIGLPLDLIRFADVEINDANRRTIGD